MYYVETCFISFNFLSDEMKHSRLDCSRAGMKDLLALKIHFLHI